MNVPAFGADNAFVPPETHTGGRPVIGFQVEYHGWVNKGDDSRQRADFRKTCALLGRPYINNAQADEAAKTRKIVVQTDSASYAWTETNFMEMAEPGNFCHLKLVTRQELTIARFDGRKTIVTTYKYGKRRKRQFTRNGDFTYFGSHTIDLNKGKVTGQRHLAGLACSELRYLELGGNPEDYASACVTGSDPFPGRQQPIILAQHSGTDKHPRYHIEATVVQPSIKIDSAVLDGPEGFQDEARRPKSNGQARETDENENAPAKRGRAP